MKRIFFVCVCCFILFSFSPKNATWVAIGDSITYLNDHVDETGNRIKKGYMSRVCEKKKGLHYINQGHNGWTSGGIADSIDNLGIGKADIYSIFLGTNDWWQGRNPGTIDDYKKGSDNQTVASSFRIIVNKIRSLNPDAKIILITPMQRTDFVYINDMKNNAYGSYKEKDDHSLEEIVNVIRDIASFEHFDLIDLYHNEKLSIPHLVKFKRLVDPQTKAYKNFKYPEYLNIPFNPETDQYPYPLNAMDKTYDGLHPSDEGYKIIASELLELLK